jgi:hypothetical protein
LKLKSGYVRWLLRASLQGDGNSAFLNFRSLSLMNKVPREVGGRKGEIEWGSAFASLVTY